MRSPQERRDFAIQLSQQRAIRAARKREETQRRETPVRFEEEAKRRAG